MASSTKAKLTEGPIAPMLTRLTIPMIVGIFAMVSFNLVDTYFVGQIGTNELAALSFTLPVVLVLNAIGMGLSMGASAVISRAIGENDKEKVQKLTVASLILAVLLAGVFVITGLLTLEPLFRLLGAEDDTLPLIKEYMNIWYIGVIFVIVPFVGNSAIRANGDTRTPATIMLSMVGLNVLLDPLFIFGWGSFPAMGLEGAALATVIARALSLVLGLWVLLRQEMLVWSVPNFSDLLDSWKKILFIGGPASLTNLVVPLTTGLITSIVSGFGKEAVAALGVASRIDLFAIMVVVALSTVLGPFVGQNLGAKKMDRLQEGVRLSQRFGIFWGIVMLALLYFSGRFIGAWFTDNEKVIEHIALYLSIVPLSYCFRSIYALDNTILNVLNRPIIASIITITMMFGVYLPLAYLGSKWIGLEGVFGSFAVAYGYGGILSYILVRYQLFKLKKDSLEPELETNT
ncbi:MAG: MATE family efflux transporter [Bacteroidia bacterium]|nr:MATE family efflux transporter [Bacteroidia bacterium]